MYGLYRLYSQQLSLPHYYRVQLYISEHLQGMNTPLNPFQHAPTG